MRTVYDIRGNPHKVIDIRNGQVYLEDERTNRISMTMQAYKENYFEYQPVTDQKN